MYTVLMSDWVCFDKMMWIFRCKGKSISTQLFDTGMHIIGFSLACHVEMTLEAGNGTFGALLYWLNIMLCYSVFPVTLFLTSWIFLFKWVSTLFSLFSAYFVCLPDPLPFSLTYFLLGAMMSIHSRGQRFEVLPNGTLAIKNVQPQDRGTYICSANNFLGRDRWECWYHLKDMYVNMP